ncbi:MAG: ATP-grasp domain-containing protein [Candidatus Hodarchaeota archaeon]
MRNKSVLIIEASAKAALPLMESLWQIGLHVIAGSSEKINSGFFSRACQERIVYPSCQYRSAEFKEWLLSFLRKRKIDQLFPVGHYGTLLVSEIQDEIRKYTRLLLPSHNVFWRGYAKIPTMKTAIAAGVPIPNSWFPHELSGGLDQAVKNIKNWPILIKPSIGAGANGIVWCYKPSDVLENWPRIENKYGICFLQEFIPPGGMQYKVDMLVDGRQRRLAGVAYGKTRMYPPDGGSSVLNYTDNRPDILDYAYQLLVELDWIGFCDFDFIVDPRDDLPKLMEINPRFPECIKMCTSVGINFPRMIYELANGQIVEPMNSYPVNRFLRFLPGDLMWFLRVNNNSRSKTWPDWFKFFDKNTAYQICSLRDPGPIIGYLLGNLIQFISDPNIRKSRLRLDVGPKHS